MALTLRKNSRPRHRRSRHRRRLPRRCHAADGHVQRAVSAELEPGIVVRTARSSTPTALATALKDFFKDARAPRARSGSESRTSRSWCARSSFPRSRTRASWRRRFGSRRPRRSRCRWTRPSSTTRCRGRLTADGTPRLTVVVVARSPFDDRGLVEAVRAAGLKPEGIDLDAFALVRMLAAGGLGRARAGLLPPRRGHEPGPRGRDQRASSPARSRRAWTETSSRPHRRSPEEIRLSIDY